MRAVKPGNAGPLKIKCHHRGTTIMLPSSIRILPDQWSGTKIINHLRAKQLNNFLDLKIADITSELLELEVTGKLQDMDAVFLRKRLLTTLGKSTAAENAKGTFWTIFNEYIPEIKSEGTKRVYDQTAGRLKAFCEEKNYDLNAIEFSEITPEWIRDFDTFMAKTAKKRNSRNIHHRNMKRIFNYAIKEKEMNIPYPYRKFKIVAEETANRALTLDQLRRLKDYPIADPHIEKSRDLFMLMTYLIGINAADLFQAKPKQLVNGRLEYHRQKLSKTVHFSIKVEPEAMAIIQKYKGKKYLLDICDNYTDYQDYLRRMDKYLKRIGPTWIAGQGGKKHYDPLFPHLSSYWSRHTWASLAADLGIPINTASEGLGHKIGSKTTAIYIHYKRKRVDTANRDVIDYILNNEEFASIAN